MFCFAADPEFPVAKGAARTNQRTKGNIYGNEREREEGGREKEGGEREFHH